MAEHDLERHLEWEALVAPVTFEHCVLPTPPFVEGVRKLTFFRDESFRLRLVAEGTIADPHTYFAANRVKAREKVAGGFSDPIEATFSSGSEVSFRAHINEAPELSLSAGETMKFSQRGVVASIHLKFASPFDFASAKDDVPDIVPLGEPSWRSDWFINGPHASPYSRCTTRRGTATFERKREIGGVRLVEAPRGGSGYDHLLVNAGGVTFLVSEVPDGQVPKWCNPLSISYPAPMPSDDVRTAIAEIVSFVFGRRLIPIGSTVFDANGWAIEQTATNPWGQGIQELCSGGDKSPFSLPDLTDAAEKLLSELVPRYLEKRDSLGLHDALLSYWLADEAFAAVDLVVYGSAVEALKNAWLNAEQQTRGQYMSPDEYAKVFEAEIDAFKKRVAEKELPAALSKKIEGGWSMSGGEQLNSFFADLPIELGKAERDAVRARNVPAHGGIRGSADFKDLVIDANAYRVLFIRTFLRLLGLEAEYIDRTSLHHPLRSVANAAGGTIREDLKKAKMAEAKKAEAEKREARKREAKEAPAKNAKAKEPPAKKRSTKGGPAKKASTRKK